MSQPRSLAPDSVCRALLVGTISQMDGHLVWFPESGRTWGCFHTTPEKLCLSHTCFGAGSRIFEMRPVARWSRKCVSPLCDHWSLCSELCESRTARVAGLGGFYGTMAVLVCRDWAQVRILVLLTGCGKHTGLSWVPASSTGLLCGGGQVT